MRTGRSHHLVPPYLSSKDENVPDGYIPLYELFVASDELKDLYGETTANELRKKTYKNVLNLFHEYKALDYEKFYNHHKVEIAEMGLNEFAKFEQLSDLCCFIKCFAKKKVNNGKHRIEISFGIHKKEAETYLKAKKKAKEQGVEFKPPKRYISSHSKIIRDNDFGEESIRMTDDTNIRVQRNAIYQRFRHWARLKNMSLKAATAYAMNKVVEYEPIAEVKELENYRTITVFDQHVLARDNTYDTERVRKSLNINTEILTATEKIVYRYCLDTEIKPELDPITLTDYVNAALNIFIDKALDEYNKSMPLQYSDPELYERLRDAKHRVEFSEKIRKQERKNGRWC